MKTIVLLTFTSIVTAQEPWGNAFWHWHTDSPVHDINRTGLVDVQDIILMMLGYTNVVCDTTLHLGEGTYYDADGSGNCSFPVSPNDLMVAAMNYVDYNISNACGTCVSVTGPSGSVKVRIVDQCPECPVGDIDLSLQAFGLIADVSAGRVPIQWHYVPCEIGDPVIYHFKSGSNPWWTAVQIRNHNHEITKFEYKADGTFKDVPRVSYNFFVESSGMGPGPYIFRVTDIYGQQLMDSNIPLTIGGEVTGQAQFPICYFPLRIRPVEK